MLIRKVTIYQDFIRYMDAGLTPVSDIEILDRLSIAAKKAGVKKPIELCVNPLISSPLLTGFFHPCTVLPGMDISEKDFQYIVLHELTHYKRLDMFYKWLVQVTVCLHWFNPLVYLKCILREGRGGCLMRHIPSSFRQLPDALITNAVFAAFIKASVSACLRWRSWKKI